MKKRNLIIYAAFIWVAACSPKPAETEVESDNVEEIEGSNKKLAFSPETLESIKSDPFRMARAAEFNSLFLLKAKEFGLLEAKKNFSGTFLSEHFKIDTTKQGVRFWYCYNKTNSKYPTFFLALEQVDTFIEERPEDFSIFSKKLIVPHVSAFDGVQENGAYNLKEYYEKADLLNGFQEKQIEFGEVLKFAIEFKNLMIDLSLNPAFGHLPSKYAVAYFKFNDSYRDFMKLNPTKIKYTMAYIPIDDDKPNFLRPILIGIDNSGKAIIEHKDYPNGTFLQKSFPPPPNQ